MVGRRKGTEKDIMLSKDQRMKILFCFGLSKLCYDNTIHLSYFAPIVVTFLEVPFTEYKTFVIIAYFLG